VNFSSVALQAVQNGYGDNTLVWVPTNFFAARPATNIVYSVAVSNVLIGGVPNNFNYNVTVFDPAVPGPDTFPPVIAGPAQPAVGQSNAYTFTAVSNATGYQWRQSQGAPFSLTDGAENGLGNFAVAASTNLYSLIVTDIVASGTHAFHFCTPDFTDQKLTFTNLLFGGTNSVLTFKSRLTYATTTQVAKVQVSRDDGQAWADLYSQAGTGGAGETSFVARTVPLSALAGNSLSLRLNYSFTGGSAFTQTNSGFGWYIDDIVLTNIEQLVAPVITSTSNTNFAFNPPQTGNYNLNVRALIYTQFPLDWGPTKLVTAVSAGSAPSVTTVAATAISTNTATLNGSANPNGLAANGFFQWGLTTNYGQTTANTALGNGNSPVAFSHALITSLSPAQTYHYRAVASNSVGIAYGTDMSFTTPAPPTATTLTATAVTASGATLNGSGVPGGAATSGYFQWGTNTSYGAASAPVSLGNGSGAVPFSSVLSSLSAGSTYHYRAVASNSVGIAYGSDTSFITSNAPVAQAVQMAPPVISNSQVRLDFNLLSGSPGVFGLQRVSDLPSAWSNDTAAVLTTNVPGSSYRFTTTTNGAADRSFFRIKIQ
jgi:hypothetical protein